jgi:dGTPase
MSVSAETTPAANHVPERHFDGAHALAPFAVRAEASRGRLIDEHESATRSIFQRDRDRVIHCGAFRRLKHKTQVFVSHEGDSYRTRLTHTLEVAQVARSISRVLGLDEDLAEALALAHDLGHPPFGHAGEDALADCMAPFDGFDHNAQTLRIVTKLEQRYAEFDGLNLTWETLEGIVKHNGPLLDNANDPGTDLPAAINHYRKTHDLDLHTYASTEAQVAALSDDIAYNNHDLDDGLRAGLFTVDDLRDLPLVGDILKKVEARYHDLEKGRLVPEVIRRLIAHMVTDLLTETRSRIEDAKPKNVDDVRSLGAPLVAFSQSMAKHDKAIRSFLYENMYRHYKVNRMSHNARRTVGDLFQVYQENPGVLPTEWQRLCKSESPAKTARVICDFIAGMTDRFAHEEHRKLFALNERSL